MKFLDYLFYRVARWYSVRWREDGKWQGIALVGLVIAAIWSMIETILRMNFEDLNYLFSIKYEGVVPLKNPVVLVPSILTLAFVFLRYLVFRKYEYFDAKWKDESPEAKKKHGWMLFAGVMLILVFSIVSLKFRP